MNDSFVSTVLSARRDEKATSAGFPYSCNATDKPGRDIAKEVSAPRNEDHESPEPIKKLVSGTAAQKLTRSGHKPREPIPWKWSLTRLTR